MKVYLLWNDGDYYGPHRVQDFVYTSIQAAKRGADIDNRRSVRTKPLEWVVRPHKDFYGEGDVRSGNYYIEEIEPVDTI